MKNPNDEKIDKPEKAQEKAQRISYDSTRIEKLQNLLGFRLGMPHVLYFDVIHLRPSRWAQGTHKVTLICIQLPTGSRVPQYLFAH